MSLLQLSSCRLFARFSPLSTTFLKKLFYNGAIKKGSRLQHSGVFINSFIDPFALCFVALVHVEIELHAHRKMLQVLTHQREENVHSLGTVNDKLIASVLLSEPSKGECFQ